MLVLAVVLIAASSPILLCEFLEGKGRLGACQHADTNSSSPVSPGDGVPNLTAPLDPLWLAQGGSVAAENQHL